MWQAEWNHSQKEMDEKPENLDEYFENLLISAILARSVDTADSILYHDHVNEYYGLVDILKITESPKGLRYNSSLRRVCN